MIVRGHFLLPILFFPWPATAMPQYIGGGGTVTDGADNASNAGIVVHASTLDISAGSGLGSGLLALQNGALRTSGSVTSANNIVLDPGTPPAVLTSPCGGAYCFGVGDSMTLNTVGNTYVSTPSLLQQMQFPSNNKAIGIWLTQGWQPDWMAGMQTAMQRGYVPVLFDYYLGDLGSMGSGAWGYVQQNAQAWLANTQRLANYLSTLNGTVSVVIQPEFNVPGVGNQAQFGAWLAQVAQMLQHAQHPGLTILTSAGVGDFGVYRGSTENASQWSSFYPSLRVAAPYLNFITFQEMRGAATGGTVVSPQQEGMSTIAGRVIAFSRYLQTTYGKPLLLGYMMMDPYTPTGDTANWSAIAAKAYAEILQVSPELQQQGVFGSLAMALFNDMNHSTINGVDYFGASSDYFGLVNSNGAPGTAGIGNGPYVLNANGQAWVKGTANAGTAQKIRNGGTIDTAGHADTFNGTLSGSGGLFVVGGGSVTLTGNNTYTGNTYIEDSTLLQLGNGGSGGGILGNVLDDGVLSFNASDAVTFPGRISGLGIVWQQGPGQVFLTGSNSYAGGTLITGGTLGVSSEDNLGSGNVTLDGGTFETTAALRDGRAFFLGPQGGTLNNDGFINYFSGNFLPSGATSAGGITLTGGGVTILSGNNTYAGNTTVDGYTTLQIGRGGLGGDVPGNVVDNGTLAFDRAGVMRVPGNVTGYGMLWQQGPGTVILEGQNAVDSGTVVAGGTLEVGDVAHSGATLRSAVAVRAMGTLRGHGTVVGNVINDGTVFPGGSIGTLRIDGNYTQNADGTLAIEVAPTAHDVLAVSGTAHLAGKLLVQVDPGAGYVPGDQYQVLTAGGGVTGAFSTIVYDPFPAYVTPTLVRGGNGLRIRLAATPGPAGMNDAPAYLGGQIYADIPTVLIHMTAQADALVFAHGKGSASAAMAHTLLDGMGTITAEQLAHFTEPPARDHGAGNDRRPSGFWLQGLGDFGAAAGSAGISGFSNQSGGAYAGVDLHHHGVTAGVAAGYVHTLLNLPTTGYADGSQANIDSVSTMLYGKYQHRGVFVQGLLGYTSESIRGLRNLPNTGAVALSDFHGQMVHATLQGGYAMQMHGVTVTPNVGVATYAQSQPGFSEYGATSLLDLRYGAQTDHETDAYAGVGLSHVYRIGTMTVTPHLDIAIQRILTGNARSITETLGRLSPVLESGVAPERTSISTDLGVNLRVIHRVSLYTEYLGNYAGNFSDSGVAVGGIWRW